MVASSWDRMRETMSFPDRDFFQEVVQDSGEPGLIVGCGTGRLTLEFAAIGLNVDGVDISPEMVELAEQKARAQNLSPNFYVQPMEMLDLPQKYRSIIVPSSSFQLVPDLDDAWAALEGFYAHLESGGTLVISIWHIQKEGDGAWGDWWMVVEVPEFEDGKTIRRWERSAYDSSTQLRHTENRYEIIEDDKVIYREQHKRSPELRNYTIHQLHEELESSGFEEIHAVSGFSTAPATESDDSFCIFGKRP
jgi:ubiquinone/menaquinone biosynthesis C-methylase UbiE